MQEGFTCQCYFSTSHLFFDKNFFSHCSDQIYSFIMMSVAFRDYEVYINYKFFNRRIFFHIGTSHENAFNHISLCIWVVHKPCTQPLRGSVQSRGVRVAENESAWAAQVGKPTCRSTCIKISEKVATWFMDGPILYENSLC